MFPITIPPSLIKILSNFIAAVCIAGTTTTPSASNSKGSLIPSQILCTSLPFLMNWVYPAQPIWRSISAQETAPLSVRLQELSRIYQWNNIETGEQLSFREEYVDGSNNDCAFIALGTTREEAIRLLLAHATDPGIRRMVAPDIHALLFDPRDPDQPLPLPLSSLRTRFVKRLNALQRHAATIQAAINRSLGRSVEQGVTTEEASAYLIANSDPRSADIFRELQALQAERDDFLPTEEIFREFIQYELGARHGQLSYVRGGGGTLDALARLLNIEVRIFTGGSELLETLHVHLEHPRETRYLHHIIWADGGHFNRLLPVQLSDEVLQDGETHELAESSHLPSSLLPVVAAHTGTTSSTVTSGVVGEAAESEDFSSQSSDVDSEAEEDWAYRPRVKKGRAKRVAKPEPAILLFRGYHFFRDNFSPADVSRDVADTKSGKVGPIFSSACYSNLGLNYVEGEAPDIKSPGYAQRLPAPLKTEIREKALEFTAKRFRNEMQKLKQGKPCTFDGQLFENAYVALHYLWVKSYTRYVEELRKRPEDREEILRDISARANMIVATAEVPDHAIRYAYGLKIGGEVLRPHFDQNGNPANPYLGKLQLILIPYKDLEQLGMYRVLEAYAKNQMPVNCRIKNEIEADIAASIPKDYVVLEMVIRVPNFSHPWDKKHLQKYGLTQAVYNRFRQRILATKGNYEAQEPIYEELVQHLINNNYSKSPRPTNLAQQALSTVRDESLAIGYDPKHLNFDRLPSDTLPTVEEANRLRGSAIPVVADASPAVLDFSQGAPIKAGKYGPVTERLRVSRQLILTNIQTRDLTTLENNLFDPFSEQLQGSIVTVVYSVGEGKKVNPKKIASLNGKYTGRIVFKQQGK